MDKKLSRAGRIIETAIGMAKNVHVRNRLEEIQIYYDPVNVYAERGYSGKYAATGNWNKVDEYDRVAQARAVLPSGDLPTRVLRLLEKLGLECEWSDEWTTCDDCGRLLRTCPYSHDWRPSYGESECECICHECAPEDDEDDEDDEDNEDNEDDRAPSAEDICDALVALRDSGVVPKYEPEADFEGLEVRLQVYPDGAWAVRYGDPGYDADHHGYFGEIVMVDPMDLMGAARSLREQVLDAMAEE